MKMQELDFLGILCRVRAVRGVGIWRAQTVPPKGKDYNVSCSGANPQEAMALLTDYLEKLLHRPVLLVLQEGQCKR